MDDIKWKAFKVTGTVPKIIDIASLSPFPRTSVACNIPWTKQHLVQEKEYFDRRFIMFQLNSITVELFTATKYACRNFMYYSVHVVNKWINYGINIFRDQISCRVLHWLTILKLFCDNLSRIFCCILSCILHFKFFRPSKCFIYTFSLFVSFYIFYLKICASSELCHFYVKHFCFRTVLTVSGN